MNVVGFRKTAYFDKNRKIFKVNATPIKLSKCNRKSGFYEALFLNRKAENGG